MTGHYIDEQTSRVYNLQADLCAYALGIEGATFNSNNYNIDTDVFAIKEENGIGGTGFSTLSATVNLGTSTITFHPYRSTATQQAFLIDYPDDYTEASTVNSSDTTLVDVCIILAPGVLTFDRVIANGTNLGSYEDVFLLVVLSLMVNDLVIAAPCQLFLTITGITITINNDFSVPAATSTNGVGFYAVDMETGGFGGIWNIVKTSGNVSLNYCALTGSHASGGANFYAFTTNGCTDRGGNTGWLFEMIIAVPGHGQYNEGDKLSIAPGYTEGTAVWDLRRFTGVPITERHSPGCGYWFKEPGTITGETPTYDNSIFHQKGWISANSGKSSEIEEGIKQIVTNKHEYNEGDRIAKSPADVGGSPVWAMDKSGIAISNTHIPCGYWTKNYTTPVIPIPSTPEPILSIDFTGEDEATSWEETIHDLTPLAMINSCIRGNRLEMDNGSVTYKYTSDYMTDNFRYSFDFEYEEVSGYDYVYFAFYGQYGTSVSIISMTIGYGSLYVSAKNGFGVEVIAESLDLPSVDTVYNVTIECQDANLVITIGEEEFSSPFYPIFSEDDPWCGITFSASNDVGGGLVFIDNVYMTNI